MATTRGAGSQAGMAMVAVLLVLALGMSALLLHQFKETNPAQEDIRQTMTALAEAKAALIGYALTYAETHAGQPQGYLPCPDADGDGSPDTCARKGESVIGRLPWRILGLKPLRDGWGACLWYAVSGSYKNNPKSTLTSDTDGQFIIEDRSGRVVAGALGPKRVIAVVLAPGRPLSSQSRDASPGSRTACGSGNEADAINQASNYLDTLDGISNSLGTKSGAAPGTPGGTPLPTSDPSVFVTAPRARNGDELVVFNDTLAIITPADLAPVYVRMDRWVAQRVATCLDTYAHKNGGRYPWAARLDATEPPDYGDDLNERFGRVPSTLSDTQSSSDGQMADVWPFDPADPELEHRCFDDANQTVENYRWWWWDEWKELVFYAVDAGYSPDSSGAGTPSLNVVSGGSGSSEQPAQAVVAAAGRRLGTISRTTNADKGHVSSYLEGDNADGDETFTAGPAGAEFNDVVCGNAACP